MTGACVIGLCVVGAAVFGFWPSAVKVRVQVTLLFLPNVTAYKTEEVARGLRGISTLASV